MQEVQSGLARAAGDLADAVSIRWLSSPPLFRQAALPLPPPLGGGDDAQRREERRVTR